MLIRSMMRQLRKTTAYSKALIDQDGDLTMPELAGALADATGVQAHPDAIGRFLRKLGFTYKKRRWSRMRDARPVFAAPVMNG